MRAATLLRSTVIAALLGASSCRENVSPTSGIPVVGGPRFRASIAGFPVDSATSAIEGGVGRCERDDRNGSVWCVLTDTLSRPELNLDHDRTVVLSSRRFPSTPGTYPIDEVRGREATAQHAGDFMALTWALSAKDRTMFGATRGTVTVLSSTGARLTGVFDLTFVEGYRAGDPTPAQRMRVSGSFDVPVVARPESSRRPPPPEPWY